MSTTCSELGSCTTGRCEPDTCRADMKCHCPRNHNNDCSHVNATGGPSHVPSTPRPTPNATQKCHTDRWRAVVAAPVQVWASTPLA